MSMRYQNILCAFNDGQVVRFRSRYRHARQDPEPVPAAPTPEPEPQLRVETLPVRISRRALTMARRFFQ
jgi:hypothetical protein